MAKGQIFGNKDQKKESSNSDYKQAFDTIKQTETTPQTRKVRLIYQSCCGCGCSDETILRIVDYDSPLQDGDRIKKMEKRDKMV
jgi:hypothetical protein